jgi:flagellin-like protein
MKRCKFIRKDEDAVSPVIATILMVAITVVLAAVLYIMVIGLTPGGGTTVPTGQFGPYDEKSSTEVWLEFARVTPEPRPTQLEIVMIRNGTTQGTYNFPDNFDGQLNLVDGTDVGTLTYEDYLNNQRVNTGDEIKMTNLLPGTDYTCIMFWSPTGDQIASKDFSTSG